jgi:peptide/nickel transport system permease protein
VVRWVAVPGGPAGWPLTGKTSFMQRYIIRRLIWTFFVVLGAVVVMFCLLRLTGDPARMMVDIDATAADVEAVRRSMGFDKPIYVQLLIFLSKAFRGDFGTSFRYGSPAFPLVVERLPATIELALAAMGLSLLVALPAGIISATKRDSLQDRIVMVAALLGQTTPVFWLGIMLIMIFAANLRWFPTGGRGTPAHLVLPALTLAAFSTARIARLVRSAMLEVMAEDYIQVARSKGLAERAVIWRHGLRNAAIPVVTIVGLQFGYLLAGAVITETVFAWPGLGRLMVQSIQNRDFPVIQAAVFLIALVFAVLNLGVDILYTYLDPRIRYD